jgi:DNA-directed RNA polymerase subunit RPC12/RpoP
MPIIVACTNPECRSQLRVPEEHLGKQVKCPHCGHIQLIAGPLPAEPAVATADNPPAEPPRPQPGLAEPRPARAYPADEDEPRPRRRRPCYADEAPELVCPYCRAMIEVDTEACERCDAPLDTRSLKREWSRITKERTISNLLSFLLGLPGLGLTIVAIAFADDLLLQIILLAVGTVLIIVGLACAARFKGQNPAWGLFGLLGIIGFVVLFVILASLGDRNQRKLRDIEKILESR